MLGVDIRGNADQIQANVPLAYIVPGDVLLFSYPKDDHAALVTAITTVNGTTAFVIAESNYHTCKPGTRVIAFNDPAIRGIYRPKLLTPLTEPAPLRVINSVQLS